MNNRFYNWFSTVGQNYIEIKLDDNLEYLQMKWNEIVMDFIKIIKEGMCMFGGYS